MGSGHHGGDAGLFRMGCDAIIIRGDEEAGAGRLPCELSGADGAGEHRDAVDQVQRLAGKTLRGIARRYDDDGFHARPDFRRSCMWMMPAGLPSSSTKICVILRSFMMRNTSAAS